MEEIKDQKFHSDVNRIFQSYLHKEDEPIILIKDKGKGELLGKIDYSKVLFDKDLNIYKIDKDGGLKKVEDSNFIAVVVKK